MSAQISLPEAFAERHRYAVEQYIQNAQLTSTEWLELLEAFDLLAQAKIRVKGKIRNFADIHQTVVQEPLANDFLSHLLQLTDPEKEGNPLKAVYARTITDRLRKSGWYNANTRYSLYLRAYCIFWWDSFAKGYIFEVTVYRDLKRTGVVFFAHDITDPEQRRLSFDLLVGDWRGDVKTSTYFLATARTRGLQHDFYITRLYDRGQRRRVWVVIMQPEVWAAIDGETKEAELSQSYPRFPSASHFYHRNHRLVVAAYEVWKEKILGFQQGV